MLYFLFSRVLICEESTDLHCFSGPQRGHFRCAKPLAERAESRTIRRTEDARHRGHGRGHLLEIAARHERQPARSPVRHSSAGDATEPDPADDAQPKCHCSASSPRPSRGPASASASGGLESNGASTILHFSTRTHAHKENLGTAPADHFCSSTTRCYGLASASVTTEEGSMGSTPGGVSSRRSPADVHLWKRPVLSARRWWWL